MFICSLLFANGCSDGLNIDEIQIKLRFKRNTTKKKNKNKCHRHFFIFFEKGRHKTCLI